MSLGSTPSFKITALAEVVDHSVEATILRRLGMEKSAVPRGLAGVELICEPLLWLYQMCALRPSRGDFVDDFDVPGRWSIAFANALSAEYSGASITEQAALRSIFESIAEQYFAWVALGRAEAEGHRLLRSIEVVANTARALTDKWETARVHNALGKTDAAAFARSQAGSRLRLSRRGAAALGGIIKNSTRGTGLSSGLSSGHVQLKLEALDTNVNVAPTTVDPPSEVPPTKRQRRESPPKPSGLPAPKVTPPKVVDGSASPRRLNTNGRRLNKHQREKAKKEQEATTSAVVEDGLAIVEDAVGEVDDRETSAEQWRQQMNANLAEQDPKPAADEKPDQAAPANVLVNAEKGGDGGAQQRGNKRGVQQRGNQRGGKKKGDRGQSRGGQQRNRGKKGHSPRKGRGKKSPKKGRR